MKPMLLVLDMQELVIPLIWRGEELAGRIAALARSARAEGVPVVAVQQVGEPGTMFDPENPGTRLSPLLGLESFNLAVPKSATDAFYATVLADVIAGREVDTLVLTGAATDYCVDATARSALSHNLDVILVSDGHSPAAEGDPVAGLTPEQIIDRHNRLLSTAIHPGGKLTLCPAAEVRWR